MDQWRPKVIGTSDKLIGVDVGGTFTDIVSIRDGQIETAKVTTDIRRSYESVLEGAERVKVHDAAVFNHASTHGLNALLTRRIPKIGFVTTLGHRDMLDMARALKPAAANADPNWRRTFSDVSEPIIPRYLRRGVIERIAVDGTVLVPIDEEQVRQQLKVLADCNVQGVAICLLNSYVNGQHEVRVREISEELLGNDTCCSISSEVSPLAGEYARASTTMVDVLMKIIYGDYSERLATGLTRLGFRGALNFADCAANLEPFELAMSHPVRILFSGPAAGTVASAHLGRTVGEEQLICADVGGTSCDISVVIDGQPVLNTTFELEHDLIVNTLSNEIVSVGAGGGSIVSIDPSGELKVGPGSAGAEPGPACYARGGVEPTTTDVFLLMGILDGERFAAGRASLDPALSRSAIERLDSSFSFDERVRFAYHTALNNVAEGIFDVIVKYGIDPRHFTMVGYGAAGGMMLPALLERLNLKSVIIPPHPGLFSALGLVSADQVHTTSRTVYMVLSSSTAEEVDAIYSNLENELTMSLSGTAEEVEFVRSFDGVLAGQVWHTPFVDVPAGRITPEAIEEMVRNFHDVYERRSGTRFADMSVQGVTYRVTGVVRRQKIRFPSPSARPHGERLGPGRPISIRYFHHHDLDAREFERDDLMVGDILDGPAVIREPLSTVFVGPGQAAVIGAAAELVITRAANGTV